VAIVQKYANNIIGVPVAKITSFIDLLATVGMISINEAGGGEEVILKDIQYLEDTISYITEQNLVEPSKKRVISPRSFVIMSVICKYIDDYPPDTNSGMASVNLAEILTKEKAELVGENAKDSFRLDELEELTKLGLTTQPAIKDTNTSLTSIKSAMFKKLFSYEKIIKGIESINVQKANPTKAP